MKSWGHWPWKPLVLPTHFPPGQELTQMGQQKKQQKWWRWSFNQAPWWQIQQEVCGYRAAVNKLQSWSLHLARSSPDSEPGRETSYQHSVFDWLLVHPAVFTPQEGTRSAATLDRSCPSLRAKHLWPSSGSTPLWCWRQWGSRPAVKNGKQVGAVPMSYSFHQLDTAAQVTVLRLRTGYWISHLHRLKNFPFRRMAMRHTEEEDN